nr:hypothetical protein [Comamonas testosteroni]
MKHNAEKLKSEIWRCLGRQKLTLINECQPEMLLILQRFPKITPGLEADFMIAVFAYVAKPQGNHLLFGGLGL